MGRKKIVEIDEKYVDEKKHQMVTYIIGKAYVKKFLRRNIVGKIVGRLSPKKRYVLISNGASLNVPTVSGSLPNCNQVFIMGLFWRREKLDNRTMLFLTPQCVSKLDVRGQKGVHTN